MTGKDGNGIGKALQGEYIMAGPMRMKADQDGHRLQVARKWSTWKRQFMAWISGQTTTSVDPDDVLTIQHGVYYAGTNGADSEPSQLLVPTNWYYIQATDEANAAFTATPHIAQWNAGGTAFETPVEVTGTKGFLAARPIEFKFLTGITGSDAGHSRFRGFTSVRPDTAPENALFKYLDGKADNDRWIKTSPATAAATGDLGWNVIRLGYIARWNDGEGKWEEDVPTENDLFLSSFRHDLRWQEDVVAITTSETDPADNDGDRFLISGASGHKAEDLEDSIALWHDDDPDYIYIGSEKAEGEIVFSGTPNDGGTVTVSDQTYTFKTIMGTQATASIEFEDSPVEGEQITINDQVYVVQDLLTEAFASGSVEIDTPLEGETITVGDKTYKLRADALGAGVKATATSGTGDSEILWSAETEGFAGNDLSIKAEIKQTEVVVTPPIAGLEASLTLKGKKGTGPTSIEYIDPSGPSEPLALVLDDGGGTWSIEVSLETDGDSLIITTAEEVYQLLLDAIDPANSAESWYLGGIVESVEMTDDGEWSKDVVMEALGPEWFDATGDLEVSGTDDIIVGINYDGETNSITTTANDIIAAVDTYAGKLSGEAQGTGLDEIVVFNESLTGGIDPEAENDVYIGVSAAATATNLALAIMAGAGEGTNYGTGTTEHDDITAAATDETVSLTAKEKGVAGNSITLTSTQDGGTVTAFADGADAVPNEIARGNAATTADNLKKAINGEATEGTNYSTGTDQPDDITATVSGGIVTLTAGLGGEYSHEYEVSADDGTDIVIEGFDNGVEPLPNEVLIDGQGDSQDNLVAALTLGEGEGTLYGYDTEAPADVQVKNETNIKINAIIGGTTGNTIALTETCTNVAIDGSETTLTGGEGGWELDAEPDQLYAVYDADSSAYLIYDTTNGWEVHDPAVDALTDDTYYRFNSGIWRETDITPAEFWYITCDEGTGLNGSGIELNSGTNRQPIEIPNKAVAMEIILDDDYEKVMIYPDETSEGVPVNYALLPCEQQVRMYVSHIDGSDLTHLYVIFHEML